MFYKIAHFLRNEYIFAILSRMISICMSMFHSILIARYLGASLRGSMSYISGIVSIVCIIITFGMHQAYPYLRKKYSDQNIFKPYVNLTRIIYLFYTCFCVAGFTFFIPFDKTSAVIFILIPLASYSDLIEYLCLIESPNKKNFIATLISVADLAFIVVLYVFTKSSFWWMFAIMSFSYALKIIAFSFLSKCPLQIPYCYAFLFKEILRYGFFPMLALLMTTLNYRIDTIMLKQYENVSMNALGVYAIGISLAEKITLIPDILKGVLVSKLAKGAKPSEVAKISRLCFATTIAFCIFVLFVGYWLVPLLYGNEYEGAYTIIFISATGCIFIGYFKLIAQYNIINKKQLYNVLMLGVSIIINVIGNLLLVPNYGIVGAAISTSIGHFVCGLIFVIYFCRQTSISVGDMFIPMKGDFVLLKNMFAR